MFAVLIFALLFQAADNAQSLYDQGVALFRQGRYDESAAALLRAASLAGRSAPVWKALGAAYAAQSKFEQAEEPFAKACKLDPKLADACYYSGRNRYTLNRFNESLDALRIALKNDERAWRVHTAMALDFEALGRADEAEQQFEKAMKLYSHAPAESVEQPDEDPRIDYGAFLFRAGRIEDSLRPLTDAVSAHPDWARTQLELGRTLYQLGQNTEAAAHLERAVALEPDSQAAHLLLGKALLRLDRPAEAERHLEKGRALDSQR